MSTNSACDCGAPRCEREGCQDKPTPRHEAAAARALLAEVEQLRLLVEAADEHARQPIDLNYIAVPKDAWEDITRVVRG